MKKKSKKSSDLTAAVGVKGKIKGPQNHGGKERYIDGLAA